MAIIEKGQRERILKSIEVLKLVCELFDQIRRDAKWRHAKRKQRNAEG